MRLYNKHPQKTSDFQLQEHRFLQVFDLDDDLSLSQEEGHKEECKGNCLIFFFLKHFFRYSTDKETKIHHSKRSHPAYRAVYME